MFYRLIDFDLSNPVYSGSTITNMPAGVAGDDTKTFGTN
jgi:hypothetical protein